MGEELGLMHGDNLNAMLEDVHSLTEDLYKDVLDQYKK
jgi:hypothetical protein